MLIAVLVFGLAYLRFAPGDGAVSVGWGPFRVVSQFRHIATTEPCSAGSLAGAGPRRGNEAAERAQSARYSSRSGAPTCGRGVRKAVSAFLQSGQRPPR